MLEIRNLSVSIGGRLILSGIDLDLLPGRVLVMIGPNGAGKTTLLRAINGWIQPRSGTRRLNGKDLSKMSRREIASRIAVVAQEPETRFPISVEQFVLAGQFASGNGFGWEQADDIERARQAIADCGLTRYSSQLIDRLSGGERQRVVLARALATRAEILLLDEPTANLDIKHQAEMLRLVRRQCRSRDSAAIVITHDLNLGAAFADEMIILSKGEIVGRGAPAEILTAEAIYSVFGIRAVVGETPGRQGMSVMSVFET